MCNIWRLLRAIPRQINYLIDEASNTGKGSNAIVSMLHHFFQVHALGETEVHLHADNCVGQNKNNTMLHYLIWRVMVGLHRCIILSFLVVGHTKFAPDWCFGLLKRSYRRAKVGCLADLERVVDLSAEANIPQLVGKQEGETIVPTYDWMKMFSGHLRKLKNIKKYHHFTIDGSRPGAVSIKLECDAAEESISLLIDPLWAPSKEDLPLLIPPSGLSLERQWYVYKTISEFCPPEVRDTVCPKPTSPSSSSSTTLAIPITTVTTSGQPCSIPKPEVSADNTGTSADSTNLPTAKRRRGLC